ncbi:anti-sigma B factor RsbW [Salibacterium salarium]|uniref:Serine-protein kinase RsbW n=1 Tax=Salibacterium salarium TaxID=284579 RepID=A0A428MSM2_9BACI|nr:anti-sigma B factor RsbW [Salibacterium salarium]RSL29156.1 anti-sigma B factor RsbW [Salibacterium salarium]
MDKEVLDHVEMKIPARAEYVGVARLTISGIASRSGYSYDDIEDLKIAVAEACTNVVDHAYDEGGYMGLFCDLYKDKIEIVVSDRGQSFHLEDIKKGLGPIDSAKPIEDLREGGLGLFLIDSLMDKVEINGETGVAIVMTKFLQRDGREQDANGFPAPTNAQK